MKLGLLLWPKVVRHLTSPEKWLKDMDWSAVGHAPGWSAMELDANKRRFRRIL